MLGGVARRGGPDLPGGANVVTKGPGALVERLQRATGSTERSVVGLSSGTSRDGVDAALVRVRGDRPDLSVELVGYRCIPYEAELAAALEGAESAPASRAAHLDLAVGEAFAAAAGALLSELSCSPDDVSCIGSHGQTIYHEPPGPGRTGTTFQIGDLNVIAERTGIPTIGDFRRADVAAGGSGAPLIPLVDWLLYRRPNEARLLLNIGGIANVTMVVPALEDIAAFDTGPGNTLSDAIVREATHGRLDRDENGQLALEGAPDGSAGEAFLATYDYFTAPPPKSTGKELFGVDAARRLSELATGTRDIGSLGREALSDLLATAALVVGLSIARGLEMLPSDPPASELIVSGGGVRNRAIMKALDESCGGLTVRSLEDLGHDPDAKEAVGFAVLAHETLYGRPGNVPGATGARRPVVLGKLAPGL
ncbi:MAG: anhydro-N-acetylmuramic acid kinase [Candidatus Eisenbacteria bacterium]|nr:anhydro-N-acetylmuramic acid kinase [Candidatus Eisenbacteria bacterium]